MRPKGQNNSPRRPFLPAKPLFNSLFAPSGALKTAKTCPPRRLRRVPSPATAAFFGTRVGPRGPCPGLIGSGRDGGVRL